MRETDFVSSLAKGLAVIEAFDAANSRLSITDISRMTGLERATARRCLLTLAELGYAEYDGKFFTLSPRILRLGHSYLSSTPLPRLMQPFLDQLSERTGESASASVLDGNEIVYIARASHKRVMSINLNPGSRLPTYCSSMGRVLLASMAEDEARRILETSNLKANTPRTKTSLADLMHELQRVREQGYAAIDQELEIGLCSIAVPVRNMRGVTVAAINVGAQAARVSIDEMIERYLPVMQSTRDTITSLLV
ncbi:IclR family transcriptional regulator [Phyllobacterium zundukense]|uniref:IclR family transcriptional regulator n=1 Tax=Phyllobacterium zundukense TaxID=1867719 RepID=A0A2N9VQ09_9HYPH|nr:IclR family transcriptional regulator [Phyllobacterium zundukense]ATU94682.1 IclR family transcriptional regulator [Phyllobacterium zundukense]PIO41577.1 IclR family transcriptional regulator [Phyllobacterium zundukense]